VNAAPGLAHDTLLPRPPGGLAPGALLALLVHGALIAALTLSVQWRSQPADVVSAELWAAVPQNAAPRAEAPAPTPQPPTPAPPPPPPPAPAPAKVAPPPADAQIATEKARREKEQREQAARERDQRLKAEREEAARDKAAREKAERDRAEREKDEREAADKLKRAEAAKKREAEQRAEKRAEEERLAAQREANLKRLLGQAGATGGPSATGTDLRNAAPSASYVGRLVAVIKPNIVFADTVPGNPAAEVEVSATASGSIIARRLRKSSGHKEWDEAVLRAIDRTGTLPRDVDGRVPTNIVISFRPQE
jgi:colicin import membrane protein